MRQSDVAVEVGVLSSSVRNHSTYDDDILILFDRKDTNIYCMRIFVGVLGRRVITISGIHDTTIT